MNRGRGRGGFPARGGRGRGGGPNVSKPQAGPVPGVKTTTPDSVPMDMVRPVLPPLYPEYCDGTAYDYLDVNTTCLAPDFLHFNKYLKSNYAINLQVTRSAFDVPRYTDAYEHPLKVQPNLHYVLDKKFFPKELSTKSDKLQAVKVEKVVDTKEILEKYTVKEQKRNSESDDEPSSEKKRKLAQLDPTQAENLELKNAAKSMDPDIGDGDDEDEDEVDEEMDEGNDYMNDYFDNGEGYLSEDDALEEGDVF